MTYPRKKNLGKGSKEASGEVSLPRKKKPCTFEQQRGGGGRTLNYRPLLRVSFQERGKKKKKTKSRFEEESLRRIEKPASKGPARAQGNGVGSGWGGENINEATGLKKKEIQQARKGRKEQLHCKGDGRPERAEKEKKGPIP